MKIAIASFGAQFPRIHPTRLNDNLATVARNVELGSGLPKPMHGAVDVLTLPAFSAPIKAAYRWKIGASDYWLQFRDFVDVIRSPIADDDFRRIYWSGDSRDNEGNVLYSFTPLIYTGGTTYPVTWRRLGVPAPQTAPIIASFTPPVGGGASDDSRIYCYTYVTDIGEESSPSPASANVITPDNGSTVVLSSLLVDTVTSAGRNITKFRIYRSATGSTGNAQLYFVDEIPSSAKTYSDTVLGSGLAEQIKTTEWDSPRLGMVGLGLTGYGIAFGFTGKVVCLSVPFIPYAFPRSYELTTQYDVVAIGHYDSYLVVGTRGNPVIINGIDPTLTSMQELPILEACVSKRSMVSMGHSAVYASPNGLVVASGATAVLATSQIFGQEEWAALNPSSIHAVEHRGKYLFFWQNGSNKGGFIFNPLAPQDGVISISQWALSTFHDLDTDILYLLQEGGLLQRFDDPNDPIQPFLWRSKVYSLPSPKRMLAGRVIADNYDNLTLRVYADGRFLYSYAPSSDGVFRLPNHSVKRTWQLEIEAKSIIREISIAQTKTEYIA